MDIFRFKQFGINQAGCAMKVNTDGVLLGAIAGEGTPESILDIGTGTGVVALMLAQRFPTARVDAVDIDVSAAKTAGENFEKSDFRDRLSIFPMSFEEHLNSDNQTRYDLIVSNPPFFLNSLASKGAQKSMARHTDEGFFEKLVSSVADHLTQDGSCTMVLPPEIADLVNDLFLAKGLHLQAITYISSFPQSQPHREIVTFGKLTNVVTEAELTIYEQQKVYSTEYRDTLKNFLTIF
ncbi:methyltransferase domain-containing protein [Mucilaginibacter terrenus]|uniref:tRNA1(Val) (adenine(37)-N6)-methyltransferase n=1 Tax=Mucilaginibacter terrenus TaxID=2482727 RepID=A0A3E2NV51_9SPHI|nr:methyltransferase [Mucilaginibacter terrenus]RFZ84894.1 methyltransferase domain-containing protein [Mucilaginibacter terrenus]